MPCKFDYDDKGAKEVYSYFLIYNYTLGPDNIYTRLDLLMKYDDTLTALKTGIDNAILEQRALQTNLGYIPKIEQSI